MDSKEANKLKNEVEQHINSIKEDNTIIKIFNIINPVRVEMDKTDIAPVNFFENLVRKRYKDNYRKLCIIDLKDILDWGVRKYDVRQAEVIISALNKIKEIHDKTFWEKLISVFRGS